MRHYFILYLACFSFCWTNSTSVIGQISDSEPEIRNHIVVNEHQTNTLNHFSAHARLLHYYISEYRSNLSPAIKKDIDIEDPEVFLPADIINDFIITKKTVNQPAMVRLLIETQKADLEQELALFGAKVTGKMGNIWAVQVPLSSYLEFSKIEGLIKVDLEQNPVPALDKARVEVNADVIHNGTGLPMPFKGKDVILGVIDGGFDALHPSFRHPDRSSRVTRWWNFLDTLGTPPAGYDYGSEYTTSQQILNKATDAEDELHGTHVAGICGGSGEEITGAKYIGLAPESEMVWVAIPYGNKQRIYRSSTADALKYIFDYAESVKKPCVINNSFGFSFGPHDGTDLLSRACEQMTGNGKIIVASAGNNGERKAYLKHDFSATQDTIKTLPIPAFYNRDDIRFISGADIWGTADTTLTIGIQFWDRKNKQLLDRPPVYYKADGQVFLFDAQLPDGSNTTVEFASSLPESNFNQKQNITLRIRYFGEVNFFPILSITAKESKTDSWAGFSYYGSQFVDEADNFKFEGFRVGDTISNMAATHCNSKSVIAVASHTLVKSFTNKSGRTITNAEEVGARANYSARGPAADGRNKPDISAPGHWIVAPGSSFDNSLNANLLMEEITLWNDVYSYLALTGTSMSAPVTAGTVALMLQANPNLNPEQVLQILKRTAKKDNFTGEIPETGSIEWGWGKLNALDAVKEAILYADRDKDINTLNNLVIYPNPLTNGAEALTVILPNDFTGTAMVFDLTGRLVYSEKLNEINNNQGIIHLNITRGLYTLKITNDKGYFAIAKIAIE